MSENIPNYEDYERQSKEISNEIEKVPLVCEIEKTMDVLKKYNPNNEIVQKKANKIASRFSQIRRVRGDGSCFFRIKNKDYKRGQEFLRIVKGIVPRLVKGGMEEYLVEEFANVFVEIVEKVASGKTTMKELMETMNEEFHNNCIIFLTRYLTSHHLRENKKDYECFVTESYSSVVKGIEVMTKDCENIHITAITKEMKFDMEVVYLNFLNEDVSSVKFYKDPKIFVLYRPGHYELLYN